jgi:hypothetical protein
MDQPDRPIMASLPPERPKAVSNSFWRQSWLNLRVWVPFLLNPTDRDRQVVYWARDSRDGLMWKVAMPKQCWECGTTDSVKKREFRRSVRSFEYPLPILVGTLSMAALLFVLGVWLWWMLLVGALVMVALCGALLLIKCWIEDVRVIVWSCARHSDDLPPPELVVDREYLYLYAPTATLAQEANAQIKEERLRSNRARAAARGGETPEEPPITSEDRPTKEDRRPPRVVRQPKEDLPPLKLADDE